MRRYLLLATRQSILVYLTANSLLYRKFDIQGRGRISGLALSEVDQDKIYVCTTGGKIVEANWLEGRIIRKAKLGSHITSIKVSRTRDMAIDIVDFVDVEVSTAGQNSKEWKIWRCECPASKLRPRLLLEVANPLSEIQVLESGRVIFAPSERHVFLGFLGAALESEHEQKFTWYQFESPDPIISFNAKAPASNEGAPSNAEANQYQDAPVLDLAIGSVRGQVYVYEDLLSKVMAMDKAKTKKRTEGTSRMNPRTLHWHRGPVNSVKWSLDGNYILSGGNETVMLLWQLQTGKRQELPHLTSAIDSLTVSPSGTSYAVQLADNSVIVLSTAELQPTAHVSGIQSLVISNYEQHHLSTVALEQSRVSDLLEPTRTTPAVLSPQKPNLLFAAVPSSQPRTEPSTFSRSKPFLQTYDMSTAQSLSRQALTRNNATHINTGPEANRIGEPDVKLLAISADGSWLASVEEWTPPRSDLDFLAYDQSSMLNERGAHLETYLKFWSWDHHNQQWTLETRVDTPHMFGDNITPARVLDLVADPTRPDFATSGEDGHVRIWRARKRFREGGLAVRDAAGFLVTWETRKVIELESPVHEVDDGFTVRLKPSCSRLAHSQDGSLLASCHEYLDHDGYSIVRLIDPVTGEVLQSRPDLFTGRLAGVGFLKRCLIVLSESITVWDLVDDELHYQYRLVSKIRDQNSPKYLAVNSTSGTFAIALPTEMTKDQKSLQYRMAVFDPDKPEPVFASSKTDAVTALLSVPGQAGYVFINDHAEARTLRHAASAAVPVIQDAVVNGLSWQPDGGIERLPEPVNVEEDEAMVDAEVLAADDGREQSEGGAEEPESEDGDEGDKPVVRQQQLAAIFEGYPSYALPPMKDIAQAIVDLYAKKPRKGRKETT